jgi:tRNA(adenine34) deaminase
MRQALDAAREAADAGDVPVGAVLVDASGSVVATDRNRREELADPTAHAEMLVLSRRARDLGDWRLSDHTLVVTLEPCPMCAGAAVLARLERIVYGAADLKAGAAWSLYNIPQDRRLNHRVELVEGVLAAEAGALLEDFFGDKRRRDESSVPSEIGDGTG